MNDSDDIRPVRDWHLMLAVFAALLIIACAGCALVYYDAINIRPAAVGPASASDVETITAARRVIDARAAAQAQYLGAYHFVDPSQK